MRRGGKLNGSGGLLDMHFDFSSEVGDPQGRYSAPGVQAPDWTVASRL
jgi:hypothetical protein